MFQQENRTAGELFRARRFETGVICLTAGTVFARENGAEGEDEPVRVTQHHICSRQFCHQTRRKRRGVVRDGGASKIANAQCRTQ